VACEASDRVDNRLDCRQICDRYAECIDEDYDVDECRDNCRDSANDDGDFESRVEECSDCIDGDDSCVESTFQCTAECAGIVP
jgi:hypothetical protein